MVRLQAKGGNPIAAYSQAPVLVAESETRVVFAAFREAAESLLELVVTPQKSQEMESATLGQLIALSELLENIKTDLAEVELMLTVARSRTMGFVE